MREKLRIIERLIPVATLIVVIIVGISTTVAWVSENREAKSSMAFEIDASQGVDVKRYDIYKRDGGEGARNVTGEPSIEMTEYDTVFTDRNVDTPIVMRIQFDNIPEGDPDIILSIGCNGYWTDKEKDGEKDPEKIRQGKLYHHLSNLANVRFGIGNADLDKLDPDDDAPEIYDGVVSLLEKNVTALQFAQVRMETIEGINKYVNVSKVDRVYGRVSDYTSVDGKLIIYAEITYNDALVAAYMDQNGIEITEEGFEGEDTISFDNDMGAITFEFVEDESGTDAAS